MIKINNLTTNDLTITGEILFSRIGEKNWYRKLSEEEGEKVIELIMKLKFPFLKNYLDYSESEINGYLVRFGDWISRRDEDLFSLYYYSVGSLELHWTEQRIRMIYEDHVGLGDYLKKILVPFEGVKENNLLG